MIARAFAHKLSLIRGADDNELASAMTDAAYLHFDVRAELIHHRYDMDTHHGQSAHYQKIWKDRMTACLANPKAVMLGGFYL